MASTGTDERFERPSAAQRRTMHAVIAGLAALAFVAPAGAADVPMDYSPASDFVRETGNIRHVVVTFGKSRTVQIGRPFSKVIVGSADIADVLPASDRMLYIQGKKVGTTNVSLFDE